MFTKTSEKMPVLESTIVISGVARRLLRLAMINSVPRLLLNFGKTYLKLCAVWANAGDAAATKATQTMRVQAMIDLGLFINCRTLKEGLFDVKERSTFARTY